MPFCCKLQHTFLLCVFLFVPLIFACREKPLPAEATGEAPRPSGCLGCHQKITLDSSHNLPCEICHGGSQSSSSLEKAHAGLTRQAAHPDRMRKNCGGCHPAQVSWASSSMHFTGKNEVNAVRMAFGAKNHLDSLVDIPEHETVTSPLALVDDLLRRKCLSCHLRSPGDGYPETKRGTGCAACHIPFANEQMTGHSFVKSPTDRQCLHCHYGNFVGADYYGRFEQDFNLEYRTPYLTANKDTSPYGLGFHQLATDIHQQAGMACIDCHSGQELMGKHEIRPKTTPAITCEACHEWRKGLPLPLDNLQIYKDQLVVLTRLSGKRLPVPRPVHKAHQRYGNKAHCAVCHSQWSFNDQGIHLLRTNKAEDEAWLRLSGQGDRRVEEALHDNSEQDFTMPDLINGKQGSGLWLKGYSQRRWENPLIGIGPDGRLQIFRPVLDLHLSMSDRKGKLIFDNIKAKNQYHGYLPYTPHTTGKAGAFFYQRLSPNLAKINKQP